MKRHGRLFAKLCSWENLENAWKKARKGKAQKADVQEFSKDWENNLYQLRMELLLHAYRPKPLVQFIVRDPKTRKISKSDFRDRIVHHALCTIIESIFDNCFIADSFANQKGKGTLKALARFDCFKRRITRNGNRQAYVLKADIYHYFEEIDHAVLLTIVRNNIKDVKVLWLIRKILENHHTECLGKGMPLGNLTSQFFANVYLDALDQFVKHTLKIKYYLRYVDDFVILHNDPKALRQHQEQIRQFLQKELKLSLHPNKCKIISLQRGILFLGFRVFYHHRLLRKTTIRKLRKKVEGYKALYDEGIINYDKVYDYLQGWFAYAMHGTTYKLRKKIAAKIEQDFPNELATVEYNRYLKQVQKKK